jgi:hypothetical protein
MKNGDIIQTFANPIKCEYPIGQAKLLEKVEDYGILQGWWVAYLDDPEHSYYTLIKPIENEGI